MPGSQDQKSKDRVHKARSIGHVFAYFCKLWTITAEVSFMYGCEKAEDTAALSFALSRYHEILALADTLPKNMTRTYGGNGQFSHVVLQFQ